MEMECRVGLLPCAVRVLGREREREGKNESKKALGTGGRASWKTKTTELV